MSAWSCQDFERVLYVHLRDQLPAGDAVRAQNHLVGCSDCIALTQKWSTWSEELDRQTDVPLTAQRATRLVDAIMNADVTVQDAPVRVRTNYRAAFALVAAAAGLAGAFFLLPKQVEAPPVSIALAAPVIVGRATLTGSTAVVRVINERRVLIERGPVHFEVQPLLGNDSLEACTEHTCARVIGTAFTITPAAAGRRDRIAVEHGIVAVYPREGEGTELVLRAGEQFDAPWSGPAPEQPFVFVAAPPVPAPASVMSVAKNTGKAAPACASAEQCFARAERLLESGARAEAEAAFEAITQRFAGSQAAEDALYSLSVIAPSDERLERYLRSAPTGAFAVDAHWRLGTSLVRARKFRASLVHLQAVIDGASSSRRAEALYLLASLQDRELGDRGAALVAYRRAMAEPSVSSSIQAAAQARLQELLRP